MNRPWCSTLCVALIAAGVPRVVAAGYGPAQSSSQPPNPALDQPPDRATPEPGPRDVSMFNLTASRLALNGFDPVACFVGTGPASPGSPEFELDHRGVVYRFESADHRSLFEQDPDRFEPAYGGWCARHMAEDQPRPANPEVFTVVGGRLFVFASAAEREAWLARPEALARSAGRAWSARSGQPEPEQPSIPPRQPSGYNLARGGVGAEGYDVVSYFPEGGSAPAKGDEQLTIDYRGVRYRFASTDHRERFVRRPDRYEPAYGGWCAWAMVKGDQVEIDPKSYLVTDGRLFLFYRDAFTDTRSRWRKAEAQSTDKADDQWRRRTGEAARR